LTPEKKKKRRSFELEQRKKKGGEKKKRKKGKFCGKKKSEGSNVLNLRGERGITSVIPTNWEKGRGRGGKGKLCSLRNDEHVKSTGGKEVVSLQSIVGEGKKKKKKASTLNVVGEKKGASKT